VVPGTQQPRDPVGVLLLGHIKANFEITVGYEILEIEQPPKGNGVGLEFYALIDTPRPEVLGLLRVLSVNEGDVYVTNHISTTSGKPESRHSFIPTTARAGRLRMSRVGDEATLWAAEGSSDTFRALHVGTADLKNVRLSVYPGEAHGPVDLLIKDFRIRALDTAEAKPDQVAAELPAHDPPADPMHAAAKSTKAWLLLAGLVALTLALATMRLWYRELQSDRAKNH
jgi:hypothetical protein